MGFFALFFNSFVFMGLLAFVFAVFCIRCLVHGAMSGTSAVLRVVLTVVFACLAYFCWKHAIAVGHGSNMIDRFVFDSWAELKNLVSFVKHKLF